MDLAERAFHIYRKRFGFLTGQQLPEWKYVNEQARESWRTVAQHLLPHINHEGYEELKNELRQEWGDKCAILEARLSREKAELAEEIAGLRTQIKEITSPRRNLPTSVCGAVRTVHFFRREITPEEVFQSRNASSSAVSSDDPEIERQAKQLLDLHDETMSPCIRETRRKRRRMLRRA